LPSTLIDRLTRYDILKKNIHVRDMWNTISREFCLATQNKRTHTGQKSFECGKTVTLHM